MTVCLCLLSVHSHEPVRPFLHLDPQITSLSVNDLFINHLTNLLSLFCLGNNCLLHKPAWPEGSLLYGTAQVWPYFSVVSNSNQILMTCGSLQKVTELSMNLFVFLVTTYNRHLHRRLFRIKCRDFNSARMFL
jgi:hypothetical protein